MSEPSKDGEKHEGEVVRVKVDRSEEIEDIRKRLDAEKKAREDAEKKAKDMEDAKKAAEEKNEEYKETLDAIAEAEFAKRKGALVEKAKSSLGDPAMVKEIEDSIQKPEDLKMAEFMLSKLESTRQALVAEEKKKTEELAGKVKTAEDEATKAKAEAEKATKALENAGAPSGTAPINPSVGGETPKRGYESYMAMIKDLRIREANGDPEAHATLTAFFKKWVDMVKKDFNASIRASIPQGKRSLKEETGIGKD